LTYIIIIHEWFYICWI